MQKSFCDNCGQELVAGRKRNWNWWTDERRNIQIQVSIKDGGYIRKSNYDFLIGELCVMCQKKLVFEITKIGCSEIYSPERPL